jgi:hypothetical protein
MKPADKVLFEDASERIKKSKLDDHSKAGIGVALAMSGEACNGMKENEKLETLARSVFSLTLAVSYFMSQAPEHTTEIIDKAINGHVGNCAKLIRMQEQGAKKPAGSFVSFSLKDGIKATGAVAWIFGIVLAVGCTIWGISYLQQASTRKAVTEIMDAKLHALQIENKEASK